MPWCSVLPFGTSLFVFYHADGRENIDLKEVYQVVAHQKLMQKSIKTGYVSDGQDEKFFSPEYQAFIDEKVTTLKGKDIGDSVFPHFIGKHLPQGLTGLLIAAIFSAGMSTISGGLNS